MIGLLSLLGVTMVDVYRRPKIAILSSGDEVKVENVDCADGLDTIQAHTKKLKIGQVRDANGPMLRAALHAAGLCSEIITLGHVQDSRDKIKAAIERTLAQPDIDMIITTGGVSMGARDLFKKLLASLGTIHFGRLRMKPGKPTTFATVKVPHSTNAKVIFALPGNPVSALVTCNLLVVPALRRLAGFPLPKCHNQRLVVELKHEFRLDTVRNAYHRVHLSWNPKSARFQV